jgi:hypothetical protein
MRKLIAGAGRGFLLVVLVLSVAGCASGEEHQESATESAHEASIEKREQVAEKHCEAEGQVLAQGNDETTQCVSNEQKEHEVERDTQSGPHYEAEQQATANEEEKRKEEEAEKIERERTGE